MYLIPNSSMDWVCSPITLAVHLNVGIEGKYTANYIDIQLDK
jgi:hypothetical protein